MADSKQGRQAQQDDPGGRVSTADTPDPRKASDKSANALNKAAEAQREADEAGREAMEAAAASIGETSPLSHHAEIVENPNPNPLGLEPEPGPSHIEYRGEPSED
jgi:hypothetical protein